MRRLRGLLAGLIWLMLARGAVADPVFHGIIISLTAAPAAVAPNTKVHFTIQTRGVCDTLLVDFGDGATTQLTGPGVAGPYATYTMTADHSYNTGGVWSPKASPLSNCTRQVFGNKVVVTVPASERGPHVVDSTQPVIIVPKKPQGPTASPQLAPGVVPPALKLVSIYFEYPAWGKLYTSATADTFNLPKPSPTGAPLLKNGAVTFMYVPKGVPQDAIDAMAASCHPNGTCPATFSFRYNSGTGSVLDMTSNATVSLKDGPTGPIFVTVPLDLRTFLTGRFLVHFGLKFGGRNYTDARAFIAPGAPLHNYFQDKIYPTFQSARCQTCHSLGSHDALVQQHTLPGQTVSFVANMPLSQMVPDSTTGCDGCHNYVVNVSQWETPGFQKGINWKQMNNWLAVCKAVVAHLPTPAERHDHFHSDPRVRWAITGGRTPGPVAQYLPVATPGDWSAWLALVDPWIGVADPCAH